jgi:hypothetical protein
LFSGRCTRGTARGRDRASCVRGGADRRPRERLEKRSVLKKQLDEVRRAREGIRKDIDRIPTGGLEKAQKAFDAAAQRLQKLREAIAEIQRQMQRVDDLREVVESYATQMAKDHAAWKHEYGRLLTEEQWKELKPRFSGEHTRILDDCTRACAKKIDELKKNGRPTEEQGETAQPQLGLEALEAGYERLRKELGLSTANARKRGAFARKLAELDADEKKITAQIESADKAQTEIDEAQEDRLAAYESLFRSLTEEVSVLSDLYKPLADRLRKEEGLQRLSFYVRRGVDVDRWASRGEELIDLRRSGLLKGQGALLEAANQKLLPAWSTGGPEDVRRAMEAFLNAEGRTQLAVSPKTSR